MRRVTFLRLLQSWVLLALGVLAAAYTARGISYEGTQALILAVLLLSVFNAILKPVLILFTFPFVVLSMGIGIFLINAFLFWLAGQVIPGFEVATFWSALWGAFVLAVVHLITHAFLARRSLGSGSRVRIRMQLGGRPGIDLGSRRAGGRTGRRRTPGDDKTIDV